MRQFTTGATRDNEEGKVDLEGYVSPLVLQAYGEYMCRHQKQSDGKLRTSDNWQKGFGDNHKDVCIKSLMRHFMDMWLIHRGFKGRETIDDALAGIMFNVMAYWYKMLKEKGD